MPACDRCGASFPNHAVIEGARRTLSSRRYCLTCSPFGARNTRPLAEPGAPTDRKRCSRCARELPLAAFYPRRERKGVTPYCRGCYREIDLERQRRIKAALVAEAGGRCTRCGYSRCLAALEFHHRDPRSKDPRLFRTKHRRARLDEATRQELQKSDLVCSNCHREVHEERHLPPPGLVANRDSPW